MSCLACCLKLLIRFSVYQSEVMLFQRAWNTIEKKKKAKSSRITFFFLLFCLPTYHVQCPCHVCAVYFFTPTAHQCRRLHVLPTTQHLVLCKNQRCATKTKPQTALVQSQSLSFNRKMINMFFGFQKNNIFSKLWMRFLVPTTEPTNCSDSVQIFEMLGSSKKEWKKESTDSCARHGSCKWLCQNPLLHLGK